jgi:hypothetical protein
VYSGRAPRTVPASLRASSGFSVRTTSGSVEASRESRRGTLRSAARMARMSPILPYVTTRTSGGDQRA